MSAICGLLERGGGAAAGLDAMLAALPGPDADARWTDASVALGWRGRRPGEGEEAERLPRSDAASGLAITASARLDGRPALCEALGLPRPGRAGLSDGALILMSYARWGRACPGHLLGDYAFALWDARRQVLFCARDHAGARPFYYAHAGGRFVFASDIDAVLAAPGVSGELDEAVVATRLTRGGRFLGERTWYRAVLRLPPGHALRVERGAARLERWWRPEDAPAPAPASDDALAEAGRALLSEAVRDRLRGAGPLGVHLSGGLDSSGVAALAARELRRQGRPAPLAFAWHAPPGPGPRGAAQAAEYGAIEAVCRQEGVQVFYCPPQARDVVAFLRRDGTRCDEGTLVHEEVVQRAAAAQGVGVLLSGWGGDEGISFNGRGYYPQLLRSGRVVRLWRELRERSRRPLAALLAEAALPLLAPGAARAAGWLRRGQSPFRRNVTFIHPEFARRTPVLPAQSWRPAGVRDLQLLLLRRGHLSRRMEGWAASGARLGIEYRYPLLDRRVLELVLGLAPEQFRRGRWSRWLMRRAFAPLLPPEVCWNPDKRDPVRIEALDAAVAGALPAVRRCIEAGGAAPPRSRYLDLPRLMEHVDPERWRAERRRAPVLNALRFLDF